MRVLAFLALVGLLVVSVVAAADACDDVHCYTTGTVQVGDWVRFTQTPVFEGDADTCLGRTMDNKYSEVDRVTTGTCTDESLLAAITVWSDDASLNGNTLKVSAVGPRGCFKVCAVCGG